MKLPAVKKAITDPARLTGPEKAAVVLLSLGEEHAQVWQALDEEEIKEISQAMASLGTVHSAVVEDLLIEFVSGMSGAGAIMGSFEQTQKLLSAIMPPEKRKRELVGLLTKRDIPVIENGVYNELHFSGTHPSTLKSFDTKGLVLHCSSFSKSLTEAYRIGWALPGRYRDQVEKLKFLNTLTSPAIPQLAIAEFLERDGFEHHLRKVRKAYAQQAKLMKATVSRYACM